MAAGFLNLHKPAGITSRSAVDRITRLARPAKVGHAGTLDPLATGVLVVGVGAGTRLIEYLHELPKHYTGTFLLGRSSPTEDITGEMTELVDPPHPTLAEVTAVAKSFLGCSQQQPPIYSALKVDGRRAYDLARAGRPVELAPRPVAIYRLDVARYDYPHLVLYIECSGGTYVRSIGRDLAAALGTAAVMSGLVRTAVGPFQVSESVMLESLTPDTWASHLSGLAQALPHLPQHILAPEEQDRVWKGLSIGNSSGLNTKREVAGVDPQGRLISILQVRGDELRPVKNFPQE
jgi:tRNA pseudouridine55 synthase